VHASLCKRKERGEKGLCFSAHNQLHLRVTREGGDIPFKKERKRHQRKERSPIVGRPRNGGPKKGEVPLVLN